MVIPSPGHEGRLGDADIETPHYALSLKLNYWRLSSGEYGLKRP
jgi:hypothetical protein